MSTDHPATIVADKIVARNIRYAWCNDVSDIDVQKLADRVAPTRYSDAELREAASCMYAMTPHQMRGHVARLEYAIEVEQAKLTPEIEIEEEHQRSLDDIPGRLKLEFEIMDLQARLDDLRAAR